MGNLFESLITFGITLIIPLLVFSYLSAINNTLPKSGVFDGNGTAASIDYYSNQEVNQSDIRHICDLELNIRAAYKIYNNVSIADEHTADKKQQLESLKEAFHVKYSYSDGNITIARYWSDSYCG